MSLLTVKNITHGFGGRSILEDVSFRLLKGEHVALIGANGEGKSTFMNIITGNLMPDSGDVIWSNRVEVGYLDQHSSLKEGTSIRENLRLAFSHMYELEEELNSIYDRMGSASDEELTKLMEDSAEIQTILEDSGFYVIDSKIEEVAGGLGLKDIGLDRAVNDLSGGQRSKVLLTKLLLQNPTILLLDEPTNYLDFEHIEWLKRFLNSYENAFILISHDIPFINAVTNIIYHVENCELTRYVGNYDEFLRLYELKKLQHEKAYERQQKEVERLEDFIARNKARISTTGRAKSRMKQLDRMEMIERPKEKIKPVFQFKEARTPSKVVIEAKGLVIGYDEALTKAFDLEIERNKKIAIRGVNGIGKSTLLKTLLGKQAAIEGAVHLGQHVEIGYFEQEDNKKNSNTAIEEIWNSYPSMTNHEIRSELAKCGLTNEHITSQMMVLSGGENAKVRLCKVMLSQINVLVLDEPTNHLDVEAKDELKRALKEFKGTVLLVSHDPDFYRDFVDEVLDAEQWSVKVV
ncbi:ABC-F family ATP-binding cassette domain-containing protein [Filifactor villosus]|uniref:ABC-F family ATP-binding cassette domain-containing protein n=1 Tax=Filifactor villosus TaxID=29374 RepID=A0ABV9QI80_9FIRM